MNTESRSFAPYLLFAVWGILHWVVTVAILDSSKPETLKLFVMPKLPWFYIAVSFILRTLQIPKELTTRTVLAVSGFWMVTSMITFQFLVQSVD